jgi:small subunit ribosomal protein S17
MSTAKQKSRTGTVISAKMQKTVVVSVAWRQRHRLYGKAVRRISKFYAHDEGAECKLGDVVRIVETHPLSKTKRWRVMEIVKRGDVPEVKPAEIGAPEIKALSPVAQAAAPALEAQEVT